VLVVVKVLSDFSVSVSDISNSHSLFSVITEVDPTPITDVFFIINHLVVINSIVTLIESEVIGRENEFVILVQG
jgi:hypothetical protein